MSTLGIVLEVVALMLIFAWTVAGIYYLNQDVNVCGPRSLLWDYALTWIFIPTFVCVCYLMDYCVWKDTGSKVRFFAFRNNWYPIAIAIVTLGAYIFGQIVIYSNEPNGQPYTCTELKATGLWTWSLTTFWTHIALVFVVILFILFAPSWIFFENWALVGCILDRKRKQRGEFLGHRGGDEASGERTPFVNNRAI